MSDFAYSVALRLTVANLASKGIQLIAKDLLNAHGAAVKLQDKLAAVKVMAGGYALEKAGQGMLGFLEKSVDASKEYTRQLSLMNAAGMTHQEVAEATATAWKTSKEVITSSAAENLRAIRELRQVLGGGAGGMDEINAVLPSVMRNAAIMRALTGKDDPQVAFQMVKAIEETRKGAVTADFLKHGLDMEARALMASGGTLNPNDFLMALKYSRTSAMSLSDDYIYMVLPTLMNELKSKSGGAQSAGTITERLRQMIVGGQIPQHDIQTWIDAGLLNPAMVVANQHGVGSKLLPGAVRGSDMANFDPYVWAQKFALPAVEKLMQDKGLTEEQAITALTQQVNKNFGLFTLIEKARQIERDKTLIGATPTSYAAYQSLLQSNPDLAQQAYEAQMQNMMGMIGYQLLPRLIPLMIKFTDWLSDIAQFLDRHQTALTVAVVTFGGLGVALDLLGKVMLTAGIIKFLGLGETIAAVFGGAAMGTVALVIGSITSALTALYAIYQATQGKDASNWISSIADKIAPGGNWGAAAYNLSHTDRDYNAPTPQRRVGAPPPTSSSVINQVFLDSQQIAPAMVKTMVNNWGRSPNTTTSQPDYSAQAPLLPAYLGQGS